MPQPGATTALVVGGGMAGMASALVLARLGVDVTLVERAAEFGEVGAGLQLAPNATRLLQRWGLLERVLETGVAPENLIFRDALTGEELTRQALTGEFVERYGSPYIVAHRSDLHRVLLDAARAAGVTLVNDVNIESVVTDKATAVATAGDGTVYRSDVVIATDGLNSRLRKIFVEDEPISSGYVAYRGTVPIDSDAQGTMKDVTVFLGPDCHMVQYPLRSGELLNTVAVLKSRSFQSGEEQSPGREELEEAYADCVPAVRGAIENLWHGLRWPMYDKDPTDQWVDGRMLMLGDAAHPMLQYLAQGACQALEDAGTLEDVLRSTVFAGQTVERSAWDAALAQVNQARAERTARVQRTARVWGESWHVGGIGRTLRNLLFRSKRADDFHYTDWLYGVQSSTD